MRKPPSPLTVTTLRSGWTSWAAIAVGSAMPMPARPLAISTVSGSEAGNMRAIHSLCRPTSEMRMSSRPSALRISHRTRGGCMGKASSSAPARKAPCTRSSSLDGVVVIGSPIATRPVRRRRIRSRSPTRSQAVTKCSSTSAATVSIADDRLVALRVPVDRRVLDEVVADRDDDVGVLEAGQLVVARLHADGAAPVRVVVGEDALAHEGRRDAHAGGVGERAQRRRRVPAGDAVAGQDQRVLGVADQLGGLVELALGRLGPAALLAVRERAGRRRGRTP